MDHTHTRLARSHPYIGRAESPAGLHWGERAGGRPWVVITPVITHPPRGGERVSAQSGSGEHRNDR